LRKSNESLSAIYGGATTISVDFFENNIVSETAFLTLQSVATDSYYIESITKQIAEKALQIFKEIEKAGGFLSVLKEGTIQRKIVENAKKEQALFNNGELVLIGANKYENHITESSIELIPSLKRKKHKTLIIPIIPTRLSEKLEQKRFSDEA
jgi:methylmalonyl-CoA mutase